MSLVELFKEGGRLFGESRRVKNDRKAAEKDRKERFKLMESMDWEPTYASQTAPTFKRTESPVARAYLESFLLGNNPDATFSGAPNAAAQKGVQQRQQNQMFGTPQERAARQQQILQETPWAVQTPTAPIVNAQKQAAAWNAKNPTLAGMGIANDADLAALKQTPTGSKYLTPYTSEQLEDQGGSALVRAFQKKDIERAKKEQEKKRKAGG